MTITPPPKWGRNYSKRNTRLLRKFIAEKRIIVDAESGIIYRANGKPARIEVNYWGYERVRVKRKVRGRTIKAWFFVHKAVMLSTGLKLKKYYEINHKDYNRANNMLSNLEYIHRSKNLALRRTEKTEEAF